MMTTWGSLGGREGEMDGEASVLAVPAMSAMPEVAATGVARFAPEIGEVHCARFGAPIEPWGDGDARRAGPGSPADACPGLPREVAASLRCPACASGLDGADGALACRSCGTRYPVVDGTPILIDDAQSLFSRNDFVAGRTTTIRPESRAWRLASWLVPYSTSNRRAEGNLEELWRQVSARSRSPRILVIGCGEPGAPHERLLDKPGAVVVQTDVSTGPGTALVCDAHQLPFAPGSFDAVIIQAVLDDVPDPYRCADEIHRVLADGGIVYAETPFLQAVHDGRYDFTRFTHLGHRRLFRRFEELRSGAVGGPGIAMARLYQALLRSCFRSRGARAGAALFARATGFWLKYADRMFVSEEGSIDAAYGCYFLGAKSPRTLTDREIVGAYRGTA